MTTDIFSINAPYCVVFSGGGALGSWELGAYEHLRNVIGKDPRTILGASAGALNVGGIATGYTLEELKNLWRLDRRDVYRRPLIRILANLLSGRLSYLFDTGPLRKQVTTIVDRIGSLDQIRIDFAVTATDIVRNQKVALYRFDNKRLQSKSVTHYQKIQTKEDLIEALMGSSAIPVLFPPNRQQYYDGGVMNNSPLSIADQIGETIIFVLVPAPKEDNHASSSERGGMPGIKALVATLLTNWINLNLEQVIHSIRAVNKANSWEEKRKVCVIRPNADFANLEVHLLDFNKKVDELLTNGAQSAKERLQRFNLTNEGTWFE